MPSIRIRRSFSPTLLSCAGLKLTALDIEWAMGVTPRGSYPRDLLDASKKFWTGSLLLGTPLQVSLAYPSADGSSPGWPTK